MTLTRKYKVRSVDTIIWNIENDLVGTVAEYGVIDVKGKERQFMIVDTGQRLMRVFHSSGLNEAFSLGQPGDHIHIRFQGKVSITGGHTFNRFEVQVWTEEGTPDAAETQEAPKFIRPV